MFIRFALPFRVSRKGFCFGPLSFTRESEGKKRLAALTVLRESFLPSPVFDLGAVLHADEDRHCLTVPTVLRAWSGGGLRRVSHTLFGATVQCACNTCSTPATLAAEGEMHASLPSRDLGV